MVSRRGLALIAAAAATATACGPSRSASTGPAPAGTPVVVVTIDTLRADRLPAYGYRGVATKSLDALRADGVLFANAYTHCPLTLPAHASLLTGLLPPQHGVRNNIGYRFDAALPSLPSLLKGRGYATGASVSSWVLRRASGLGAAFDVYDEVPGGGEGRLSAAELQRPGRQTVEKALRFVDAQKAAPFFLFVHLFEPHAPYDPPPAERARWGATYEGEIAAADAAVGDLLSGLRRRGLYERALVVLASDHGEGLGDHGEEEHGILLYREVLHVPLIVKLPGQERAGTTVTRPVGLVDVLPTVTAVLGVEAPKDLPGRSLLAAGESTGPSAVYSETFYPRIHLGWSELFSLVDDRWHLIDGPQPELYDVARDPGEKQDQARSAEATRTALVRELRGRQGLFRPPDASSAADRESLQALGYLSGGPADDAGPGATLPNPKDRIEAREEMKKAMALSAQGRESEAIPALRALLRREPGLFDAQYELGRLLARAGRLDEAADAYRAAMALSPTLAPSVAPALADVCLERGDLDGAEKAARLVSGDAVARAKAAVVLGEVDLRRGRFEPARRRAVEAEAELGAAGEPAVAGLLFVRGDAEARLGRHREAEASFRREIELHPKYARAYASLALVVALQGRPAEAPSILAAMQRERPGPETVRLAERTLAFMRGGTAGGS